MAASLLQKKTYRYRITKNWRTTPSIVVLELAPILGKMFTFRPGQYVMLRILNEDGTRWRQEAYTLCNSPSRVDAIELALKVFGPFTQKAATLMPGAVVEIIGPYGIFTLNESFPSITMFAGGIGITPFLSMIRHATEKKLTTDIQLLYASHTKEEIAYFSELNALAAMNPHLSITHYVSTGSLPNGVAAVSGRLDASVLDAQIGDEKTGLYYLCGPEPFMQAIKALLKKRGTPKEHIKIEHF